jgi:hypothetical protein
MVATSSMASRRAWASPEPLTSDELAREYFITPINFWEAASTGTMVLVSAYSDIDIFNC